MLFNKDFKKITAYCFIFTCILWVLHLMNLDNIAIFLFWCFPVFVLLLKRENN